MDEEIQPQMSHNVTLFFTTDLEVEPLADQLGYALGASWDRSEHHDGTPSWYCRLLGIGVCFGPDSDESGFPFSLRLETGAGNLSRPFLYEFMAIVLHRVAHRLEVGQTGGVGYVAATGLHRIALDVGADAFFFGNPDLPNTRSELALPLIVRDLVIGVLDVQSTEPSAFDESDVEVLQILADQVALAIDNTRLFEQSQDVIRELQNAYRGQTKKGWTRWIENRIKAYHFDGIRITPATENQLEISKEIAADVPEIHNTKGSSILTVPITLRDQKLGSITLRRNHNETPWTSADLSVVNDAITQVAVALENARLLDETRRSANREQLIGEITRKIRETLDIETIAKTATQEIREALDLSEVKVHLGNPTKDVQSRS